MSEIIIRNGDLLVFIDDTGHERFAGNQPYYGLGGCIVSAESYGHTKGLWRRVRQKILGDPEAPLHAVDMPRLRANFETLQAFFTDRSFLRVAAMTTNAIILPDAMLPADAVMGKIQEEIQLVATTIGCKRVLLVVESSQRADPMVRTRWGGLTPLAPDMIIPMEHYFMPKRSAEPGLEIADFIVNAAGSQTRRYMRALSGPALDFADVFLRLPTAGCRFSLIRGVRSGSEGKIVGLDHLRLIEQQDD